MGFKKLRHRIRSSLAGIVSVVILSSASAHATIIDWNTWLSASEGTISTKDGPVTVRYLAGGPIDNLVANYPSYTPSSTFADGSIVSNAPTSANGILQIIGGNPNINTIIFSAPVVNPVMAIWSLGQNLSYSVVTSSFNFINATPLFVSGGPSQEYGGLPITVLDNVVSGTEGNGTVRFIGTFSSLSWTNPVAEDWYGFNVGAPAPVPEPGTMMLLGAGFLGLAIYGKRRRNA